MAFINLPGYWLGRRRTMFVSPPWASIRPVMPERRAGGGGAGIDGHRSFGGFVEMKTPFAVGLDGVIAWIVLSTFRLAQVAEADRGPVRSGFPATSKTWQRGLRGWPA